MGPYPDESTPAVPRKRTDGISRRARARAMVFMSLALVAGVSAAWLISRYLAQKSSASAAIAVKRIAVAAMDVPLATSVRRELVSYVDWPASSVPAGAFEDAKDIDNRVVGRSMLKGEPFTEAVLASKLAGQGMAAVIPDTMRAMTVQVNEASGVAGFIHPNDLVDVVATMQTPINGPGSSAQEYRAKVVLQNVKVIATGQDMVTENAKPKHVPVVTLLVTPEGSERLALASMQGKIQLTLRSQADDGEIQTSGVAPNDLLGRSAPVQKPRSKPSKPEVASVEPKPTNEVVEVIRGDRFEERKLQTKSQ